MRAPTEIVKTAFERSRALCDCKMPRQAFVENLKKKQKTIKMTGGAIAQWIRLHLPS